ncbi:antitoxin Xre/MbcA/ParS toxin-binding domain-containing protein [Pseudomonas sp. LB3P25]
MEKHLISDTCVRQPSKGFFDALALWPDLTAAADLIHRRLDISFYYDLASLLGLSPKALFVLLSIPAAVQRRWIKAGQLTVSKSDYAYRQALVLRDALALFEGDKKGTMVWLTQPNRALNRLAPGSMLSTFVGMDTVTKLIWKIENGVSL